VTLEGLGKLKKLSDFIRTQTRDILAFSIVFQPTTYTHIFTTKKYIIIHLLSTSSANVRLINKFFVSMKASYVAPSNMIYGCTNWLTWQNQRDLKL
jgi:hypothetical protein